MQSLPLTYQFLKDIHLTLEKAIFQIFQKFTQTLPHIFLSY